MLLILGHSIIAAIYNPHTCFLLVSGLVSGPSNPRHTQPCYAALYPQMFGHAPLPLPLKIRTRCKKGNALIHDSLADPEVVVDPLLNAWRFGELVGLYTGTVSKGVSLGFW
jgi:hypothetical protein